jgi:hypothetical protein
VFFRDQRSHPMLLYLLMEPVDMHECFVWTRNFMVDLRWWLPWCTRISSASWRLKDWLEQGWRWRVTDWEHEFWSVCLWLDPLWYTLTGYVLALDKVSCAWEVTFYYVQWEVYIIHRSWWDSPWYQDRSPPTGADRSSANSLGSQPIGYVVVKSIHPSDRTGMYHSSQHYW